MQPDLEERAKIEASVTALVKSVEKLSDRIDGLMMLASGLTGRVSNIEERLKHVPTLWTALLGQAAAGVVVAGADIGADQFGILIGNPQQPPAVSTNPSAPIINFVPNNNAGP